MKLESRFGWQWKNGQLVPEEKEQEIIRLIKELADIGVSYNRIANYINKEAGIKTTGRKLKEIVKGIA